MAVPRILATLLTVTLIGAGGYFVYQRYAAPQAAKIEYQTQPVERTRLTATVTASGTLSPVKTVQVGSQVSGRIVELLADFNSPVKKGDVIARIDPSLFKSDVTRAKASYQSSQAALTRAKADRDAAKLNLDRAQQLHAEKVVSTAEVDAATAAYKVAKASVEAAQATLAVAKAGIEQSDVNLLYTTILSPIDGVVISRDVSVGQTVAASLSAPTLFTIAEDLRAMEVHTSVAESDVGALRQDMKVRFTVDAYPNERFSGTVAQIRNSPQTVQNVVTYDAVVRVDNDALKLRPGMTASVTFIVDERRDALAVPNAALRFTPSDPKIAALAPQPEGGRGRRRGGRGRDEGEAKTEEGKVEEAKTEEGKAEEGKVEGAKGGEGKGERGERRERRGGSEVTTTRTVWVLVDGQPKPLQVQVGISDTSMTEIVGGELTEDMQVIVGATGNEPVTKAGAASSPFGGVSGGGNRGGGGGGGGRRGGM